MSARKIYLFFSHTANATITRELSAIRRMFSLGSHMTPPMVLHVPHIKLLEENSARTGFFRDGQQIRSFWKAWASALKSCGYLPSFKCKDCGSIVELDPDKYIEDRSCSHCESSRLRQHDRFFHDLRRTAVREMVRAGVPEKVAMCISGHKSRSVFEQYNIINEADLKSASERLSKMQQETAERIEEIPKMVTK